METYGRYWILLAAEGIIDHGCNYILFSWRAAFGHRLQGTAQAVNILGGLAHIGHIRFCRHRPRVG